MQLCGHLLHPLYSNWTRIVETEAKYHLSVTVQHDFLSDSFHFNKILREDLLTLTFHTNTSTEIKVGLG
jgi:hypothetical protein